jgi:hypothetical protein
MNVLIVEDEDRGFGLTLDELGVKHVRFECPLDAFSRADKDWADVLLIDLSSCGSILGGPDHMYGPILSVLQRQAGVKHVVINSAVARSFAECVQEDIQRELPDMDVKLIDWAACKPFDSLKNIVRSLL